MDSLNNDTFAILMAAINSIKMNLETNKFRR